MKSELYRENWLDTDGKLVQAHGGSILFNNGTYYWFGENKDGPTLDRNRVDFIGISCYSSIDLTSWKNEGLALISEPSNANHDLHPSKVVERPKVLFNKFTHQYVMWLHIDTSDYALAHTGVAISTTPQGPYQYKGSFRPCGKDSRDLTLFKDTDEIAYLIFSSERNRNLTIARLSEDYENTTDIYSTIWLHEERDTGREAPCIFKRRNQYYLITSACTGWEANAAAYAEASDILGPWEIKGNPCIGENAHKTYFSQGSFVFEVVGQNETYIWVTDKWNRDDLRSSTYMWLPIQFNQEGNLIIAQQNPDIDSYRKG